MYRAGATESRAGGGLVIADTSRTRASTLAVWPWGIHVIISWAMPFPVCALGQQGWGWW